MRVQSNRWGRERVVSGDQVLRVRNVEGRLHVARKDRQRTNGPPCGSGKGYDVITD